MLAQKQRLRLRQDFKNTFNYRRVTHTRYFALYQAPSQHPQSRFAFIVANKISKKAVVRNKIRRRLRQVIRKNLADFSQKKDIIISTKPIILDLDFKQTELELLKLLNKAKLLTWR